MCSYLNCILLYSFIFELMISVSALTQRVGYFQVFRKNSNVRQCAAEAFSKKSNTFRVSDSTDQCEEVYGPLNEDEIEQGYGYAKLISKSENFQPPIVETVGDRDRREYNFSGPLTTGARVDLYVAWPEYDFIVYIMLYEKLAFRHPNKLDVSIAKFVDEEYHLSVEEIASEDHYASLLLKDALPRSEFKISFVAFEPNSLEILFNDKTVLTWEGKTIRINQLTALNFRFGVTAPEVSIQVHGFKYNQGQ